MTDEVPATEPFGSTCRADGARETFGSLSEKPSPTWLGNQNTPDNYTNFFFYKLQYKYTCHQQLNQIQFIVFYNQSVAVYDHDLLHLISNPPHPYGIFVLRNYK